MRVSSCRRRIRTDSRKPSVGWSTIRADARRSPRTRSPRRRITRASGRRSSRPRRSARPSMASERVLVTGATGFVGGHLVPHLRRLGFTVRAAVRSADVHVPHAAEVVAVGDIGPHTDWSAALRSVDYVVHLAGRAHQLAERGRPDVAEFRRVNQEGTAALARGAARSGVRRLLFVSSIGAVADTETRFVDDDTEGVPDTAYGESKRAAEQEVRRILADTPCDWCILRPPLVYGPGNPGNMGRLLRLVATGLPLPLGGIRNRRSFVYVGNLVSAIAHCMDTPSASRQTFVVADDEAPSTSELLRLLGAAAARRIRLVTVPAWTLDLLGAAGDGVARIIRRPVPL